MTVTGSNPSHFRTQQRMTVAKTLSMELIPEHTITKSIASPFLKLSDGGPPSQKLNSYTIENIEESENDSMFESKREVSRSMIKSPSLRLNMS